MNLSQYVEDLPEAFASKFAGDPGADGIRDLLVGELSSRDHASHVVETLRRLRLDSHTAFVRSAVAESTKRTDLEHLTPDDWYGLLVAAELTGSDAMLSDHAFAALQERFGSRGRFLSRRARAHRAALDRIVFGRALERSGGRLRLASVGASCLPWSLPNRWFLRQAPASLETPFDQTSHRQSTVCELLESDFESYLDPASPIESIRTAGGQTVPLHRPTGTVFTHNRSSFWVENDFRELRDFLRRRVLSFRDAIAEPGAVLLHHAKQLHDRPYVESIVSALCALAEKHGGQPVHIIVVNTDPAAQRGVHEIDASSSWVVAPRPGSDYVWHADYWSSEGQQFERELVDTIRSLCGAGEQASGAATPS